MDKFTYNPKIMSKTRTAGDGMESDEKASERVQNVDSKITVSPNRKDSLLPARLVQVYATKVFRSEKTRSLSGKTTKFVPYEPYPAAVMPITPKLVTKDLKKSKNNMDINTLITQMSQMSTNLNEFKPRPKLNSTSDKSGPDVDRPSPEAVEMKKKIDSLTHENESLKEQLKQQVQVNKELKTMLVASMGEDLETQVQSLNEDKKHLASALLSSAQHLSTHQRRKLLTVPVNSFRRSKRDAWQRFSRDEEKVLLLAMYRRQHIKLLQSEQTEWLAGQCEVWRSKFLASSLMVEELAQCKKLLNEKTENLQQAIKQLLDERCRARDMMLCTYKNLYSLHEKWLENIAITEYAGNSKMYNRPIGNLNFNATIPHSTNILDMTSVNLKLSENISSSVEKQDIGHLNNLPTITEGEKNAENIMATPIDVRKVSEEPVNALVHHAYSSSGNMPRPIASCVHCHGKVQLL